MIKAFFTASQLFTILKQFGELSDEVGMQYISWCQWYTLFHLQVEEKMKYSKWKAVEIDRCLKNGITPTPGPPGDQLFEDDSTPPPPVGFNIQPPPPSDDQAGPSWDSTTQTETRPTPKPRHMAPHNPVPQMQPDATPSYDESGRSGGWETQPAAVGSSTVQLGPQQITRAQKLCKFANSALEYEDIQGAVEFLGKAMKLLQTGKEEG